MGFRAFVLLGVLAVRSLAALPLEPAPLVRFPSGLLKSVDIAHPVDGRRESEDAAVAAFLEENFAAYAPQFAWRRMQRLNDSTHAHHLFALHYLGRKVDGQYLRVHYNHKGWIEYADSTWSEPFALNLPSKESTQNRIETYEDALRREVIARRGYVNGRVQSEPVVWVDAAHQRAVAALEVHLDGYQPMYFRHLFLDEATGETLEERSVVRHLEPPRAPIPQQVYLVSPYNSASANNTRSTITLNLPYLSTGASRLLNDYVYVRRQQHLLSGSPHGANCNSSCLQDVNPAYSFGVSLGEGSPTDYHPECNGDCPEQIFDSLNVYYHLSRFRQDLSPYLADLGLSPTASRDPINVIVMAFNENVLGLNTPDPEAETNNAGFISRPCNVAEGDGTRNEVCLAFLRPEILRFNTVCGKSVADFYDVAREAVVAVHEYTHYLTDSLTHMQSCGAGCSAVSDALHEGYSDYFAVSEVSYLNRNQSVGQTGGGTGTDVTRIGEYAFQDCPGYQRDISTKRVYDDTDPEQGDIYTTSLTWSSGLWDLRSRFGKDIVDKIVLKSQTFLTPLPGFLEAVESLVRADRALFAGEHIVAIRTLFYDELHFTGSSGSAFRNTESGVLEVGFQSCANASARGTSSAGYSLLLFAVWLQLTWWLGRRGRFGWH